MDVNTDTSTVADSESRPATPGMENTPGGGGATDGFDRAAPGAPPAASNQPKSEDFQGAQDASGEPGTAASADPQAPSAGVAAPPAPGSGADDRLERSGGAAALAPPSGALADDDAAGAIRTAPGSPPASVASVPTPGNAPGVSVPSVQAAAGTSEDSDEVTGVRATALAPPGKPDGEVDTSR